MIDVIATILILYLLYKLVFDFIVPVSKTTRQFKDHVNQMRNQQANQSHQNFRPSSSKTANTTPDKKNTTTTDGEYIDFEEVK